MSRDPRPWLAVALVGIVALHGCYSATAPSHVNFVHAAINDSSWSAERIEFVNIEGLTTTIGAVEINATGHGDTIELSGLIEENVSQGMHLTKDYIRVRRPWGVYVDSGTAKILGDSIFCTQFSSHILTGTAKCGSSIPNRNGTGDSVRLTVSFDVTF